MLARLVAVVFEDGQYVARFVVQGTTYELRDLTTWMLRDLEATVVDRALKLRKSEAVRRGLRAQIVAAEQGLFTGEDAPCVLKLVVVGTAEEVAPVAAALLFRRAAARFVGDDLVMSSSER